ncbi:hypothetical protein QTA56_07575 [Acinetobacter sp. VNH17]|uniref:Uncharacterized protein n=1 Tax=Acinetobacter thutiue TaxID=2998078 RepID=A0ABT7WN30_9GAMM|nr:hypothetical protein [Acinetobacter thutiue]MCY6411991.1 hypothetical protein [Acinetobacter thutiue]MDN0014095.1 hypothetical protein [Acinetobacter thutiue]
MKDAEQMPMQYALAFLSEKADLLLKAKAKLEHGRPHNTHASPSSNTKTYVATERKHSKPKSGVNK